MYWLIGAYLRKIAFVGMAIVALFSAGLIARPLGSYLGKLWGVDDQLIIGAAFFSILVLEVYAYDLARKWWYFRARS
jgi:hypothetical protein